MDPYSAKRHALYQPRSFTASGIDYPASSDSHYVQKIETANASQHADILGLELPDTTDENHKDNCSFVPVTQPAKQIKIASGETLIPLEMRTEVFALLSGASPNDFLEMRFLKRPNQAPKISSKFTYIL